ncbi:type I-C CRISPR-associated protein Cas5 [Desulfosporosinus fructosivorans]|uniref:pre-crRNA processing endonuclease n=1 Tax=Desulfosporosinus fructosivorans TaxID=2018669 RepID=A0A4Z0R6V9_9FIRM|nr:type I-C CRISPR-associated protein Cas5c [Desulfosporosinus fructosivorans]TGE38105.1 type I-C CRISPR-associated protein Cas5 [Desulfosporosinus fructosivorans]
MGYGICLETWGDYALFSRPEMKVERVSYDVITPSAARGIIDSIYWKPAIVWRIDKVHVCNPVEFTNIRRNEVSSKISARSVDSVMNGAAKPLYINTNEDRQQRASMILKNVRYIIEAHFELTDKAGETDTIEKHYNIALRRMRKGQCYHQPCFGCREFPANFRLLEGDVPESGLIGEKDLGYMLYDMDFTDPENIKPMFFRAVMRNGIIDLSACEVVR